MNSLERKSLDNLITKHYNYLLIVSGRIIQSNRRSPKEHYDLLNLTFQFLIENLEQKQYVKNAIRTDEDFIRFTSKTMKNFKRWRDSRHNKDLNSGFFIIDSNTPVPIDNHNIEMELNSELTTDQTKEYISDLTRHCISPEKAQDYLDIMLIRGSLPLPEKKLFDEAFIEGKSGRQIAREVKAKIGIHVPHMNYCSMIKELRTKIINQL